MTTLYPAATVTAGGLITTALRTLGVYSHDQEPSATEMTEGLTQLNSLLEVLSLDTGMIHALTRETFTLTAEQNPHTWGVGGDFDSDRPLVIRSAEVAVDTRWQLVRIIEAEDYERIPDKGTGKTPTVLWFKADYPLASVYLWPPPDTDYEMVFLSEKPFAAFADTDAEVSMPPGYYEAFVTGLAVYMADFYGVSPTPTVMMRYHNAKHAIESRNVRIPSMVPDPALMDRRYGKGWDIYTDGYVR